MTQAPEASKREEGLRAIASMIAEACRRDLAAGRVPQSAKKNTVPEAQIVRSMERSDSGEGCAYTETVPIGYFVRQHKKGNNEYSDRIRQGGLDVAD